MTDKVSQLYKTGKNDSLHFNLYVFR
jgi:hypothetical protein